ncbi:MAG: ATP synthase F1 subunit epsilon [Pseudomonadota bacterium]
MKLDIVTPERQLMSTEAASVQIPGMEGDMTIMDNHAAVVTTLRPGVVAVSDGQRFVVTGGFAEVSSSGTSILAEQAVPEAEASREMINDLIANAQTAEETAPSDQKAAARQRVNDLQTLVARL